MHGYQYRLVGGCAPPPFTEKLAIHRVRIRNGIVEIDLDPLPSGTPRGSEIRALKNLGASAQSAARWLCAKSQWRVGLPAQANLFGVMRKFSFKGRDAVELQRLAPGLASPQ